MVADTLQSDLSSSLKHCVDLAKESGSSSWLTVLPILEQGFHLHKGDFQDALSLRCGVTPSKYIKYLSVWNLFLSWPCYGMSFWGYPMIRHNEIRDLTASLLTKVCHNIVTEPSLQPITSETFSVASANTSNDARLDVTARGFWSRGQDTYFDVRVFYPNASSYRSLSLSSVYKCHEEARIWTSS